MKDRVISVLRSIYDPEIPINIYELGLIYGVETDESGNVAIRMTLTAPNCPVAGSLPAEVQGKVAGIPGVATVKLDLVFDPPWDKSMMSESARMALGLDDVVSISRARR